MNVPIEMVDVITRVQIQWAATHVVVILALSLTMIARGVLVSLNPTPCGFKIELQFFSPGNETNSVAGDDSGGGGANGGANGGIIAGGVIVAVIAAAAVIVIILLLYFFVYKRSSASAHKTTKYSRPNDDLSSMSSRQNLFTTTAEPGAVQFRGQQNHVAYTGYQPPTPLYTGGSSPSRHAPPRPTAPPSQPPPRRAVPLPPPAQRSTPLSPPATAPSYPPPTYPNNPRPSAPTRPLLPTNQPPPSHAYNGSYLPPSTFKPPPPANKPALQSRAPPTSQKPSPGE